MTRSITNHNVHFIQEDNPEAIGRGIVEWHRRQFESQKPVSAKQK